MLAPNYHMPIRRLIFENLDGRENRRLLANYSSASQRIQGKFRGYDILLTLTEF